MSYILEALKKAELQRGMGQVPGIGSQHEKPVHPATGKWFWIGVAFLILNLVLLTLLLWPDSGPDSGGRFRGELPQPDPVIQEPARASAPTPVPSPSPSPVVPPTQPDTNLPAVVAEPAPIPAPSSRPVAPPVERAAPDTPSTAAVPVVAEPVPSPAPVVESSVPAEFEAEPEEEFDYEEEEGATDISSLPVWPQIPDHLFQQLTGGIPLDVHVYSDIPEDRFVLINLQKYREGEQLQEGPLLDEITPEGVILSFQGQQFLVRAQ